MPREPVPVVVPVVVSSSLQRVPRASRKQQHIHPINRHPEQQQQQEQEQEQHQKRQRLSRGVFEDAPDPPEGSIPPPPEAGAPMTRERQRPHAPPSPVRGCSEGRGLGRQLKSQNPRQSSRRLPITTMHPWFHVLAVLAILQGVVHIAGTDSSRPIGGPVSVADDSRSSSSVSAIFSQASNHQAEDSGSAKPPANLARDEPVRTSEGGGRGSDVNSDITEYREYVEGGKVEKGAEEKEEEEVVEVLELNENDIGDIEDGASVDGEGGSDSSSSKPDPKTLVEIEKNLLSLFGFPNRPKIDRSKVVIPEAMKQLYAQIMGHDLVDSVSVPKEGLNTRNANTVRSFTHEESHIDERFQHHHRFRLLFNVSSIPRGEKLRAAELTLTREGLPRLATHQVLVYDIVRPGVKGRRAPTFLLVDSRTLRTNESGTASFDVMPAVERWLRQPRQNHGLFVQVTSRMRPSSSVGARKGSGRQRRSVQTAPAQEHVRLRRSTGEAHDRWVQKQPLLFAYTDDGRHKQRPIRDAISSANRARRASAKRSSRRKNELCQRKPLYVDFSDVGWNDWIVAPPGYEAYFCQGDCRFPIADHLNTTNHAIVQTLVNSYNPTLAPKACCVPTQLSSISMLYLNEQNKVVLKNYQDMTVVGCGCR